MFANIKGNAIYYIYERKVSVCLLVQSEDNA